MQRLGLGAQRDLLGNSPHTRTPCPRDGDDDWVSVVPAGPQLPLYRPDHCARLAYYKDRLAQAFVHPVWLCGHLYGWYASPLTTDTAALDRLL